MSSTAEPPRIYASFAAFTRADRRQRGLPDEEPAAETPVVEAPSVETSVVVVLPKEVVPRAARVAQKKLRVKPPTLAELRAEGIVEIGRATASSLLFVRTHVKLHLLHVSWIPDRKLDAYAVKLAVAWIEDQGIPSYTVARDLGVSQDTLRKALNAAGYQRLGASAPAQAALAFARSKRGNRRGRLTRVAASSASA